MLVNEEKTRKIINACMEVHNELGNGNIIVELKAVSLLSTPHKAQVLNYLNAANMEIGLLINFGQTSLKWERITKFIKRNVVDISNPCGNSKGEN